MHLFLLRTFTITNLKKKVVTENPVGFYSLGPMAKVENS